WFQMEPQARGGADAHDGSPLFLQRPTDVFHSHVDPRHGQTDGPRRLDRSGSDLGMNLLRDVHSTVLSVLAPRGGGDLAIHDKQAVIRARDETLDQNGGANVRRRLESTQHLLMGGQATAGDSAALVVARLDDDWQSDFFRCSPGIFGTGNQSSLGNGDSR